MYGIHTKVSRVITIFFIQLIAFTSTYAQSEVPKIVDFKQLQERVELLSSDSLLVVNFWATWCKPCVEEMPIIENIVPIYKGVPVKVLLVSLDFTDKIEQRLMPFIKEKVILSEVLVLDESDPNNWIPKVHQQWSGAIPACLFVYKNKLLFHEGEVTPDFIENALNSLLQ